MAIGKLDFHGANAVAIDIGGARLRLKQEREPPGAQGGGQHALQNRQCHARLMAQPRNGTVSRIEEGLLSALVTQFVVLPIIRPNVLPQIPVAARASELLDPAVFVRRNGLLRELPANPVRRFGQHDPPSQAAGGECRGAASQAAAHDENVGLQQTARPRSRRARIPLRPATRGTSRPPRPDRTVRGIAAGSRVVMPPWPENSGRAARRQLSGAGIKVPQARSCVELRTGDEYH